MRGLLILALASVCQGTDYGIAVVLEYADSPQGSTAVAAAQIAVDALNQDTVLTQGGRHRLVLTPVVVTERYSDVKPHASATHGPDTFDKNWVANDYYVYTSLVNALQARRQCVVIGPYFSAVAIDFRVHGDYFQVPIITPAATDPFLTVGTQYFFQPIHSDDHYSEYFQQFMTAHELGRVAVIYTKDADGVNGVQHFLGRCLENGITLLGSFAIQSTQDGQLRSALERFRTNGATVFFIAADEENAKTILSEAHSLNLLSTDYIWMVQGITSDPEDLDPIFNNVLTVGLFDDDMLTSDFLTRWNAPASQAAYPPAGVVSPSKDTVLTYDIAWLAGKAILQNADKLPDGGHQLGSTAPFVGEDHKWAYGPVMRDILHNTVHNGTHHLISFDDYRLSKWEIKGSQLNWAQGELSAKNVGLVTGDGDSWGETKGSFSTSNLIWNATGVSMPTDRPPLSRVTAKVVISTREFPFCHVVDAARNVTDGFACSLFKLVEEQLGFTSDVTIGNFTDLELISMVANGEADIAVGHIALHPAITEFTSDEALQTLIFNNVEYTHPYWTDGVVSVGRISDAKQTTDIWHFVGPFAADMWALWFGWTVFAALLFYLFERESNEDLAGPLGEALMTCFWFSFTATVACQDMTPKTRAGKISSWALYFLTVLVIAAYTANLAAFLVATGGSNGPQISDIGVTVTPNQVGIELGSVAVDVLKLFTTGGNFVEHAVPETLAEDLVAQRLKMVVEEGPLAEYIVNEWGATRGCPLRVFGSRTGQVSYALAVRRQWGYAAELSRRVVIITAGQDAGRTSMRTLYERYFLSGVCPVNGPVASATDKIKAADMGGAFVCYAAAAAVSLVVFASEKLCARANEVTEVTAPDTDTVDDRMKELSRKIDRLLAKHTVEASPVDNLKL